ncbi:protein Abitram [Cylas formicarius]|uniref:protein Abitram n=1 Tax=Cylas formicarius TaxID=197179 RepID=UPI002958D7B5|nr:protein Abitram [Cylas formicarius]
MMEDKILEKIKHLSVPILQSITEEEKKHFKHFNERYYEDKYCVEYNDAVSNRDVLIRLHTNKLVLICLARGHDIIRHNKVIEKINFNIEGSNLLDINLSGRKKAGARKLKKNHCVCYIKCKGEDTEYPVYTCVQGSLIEVNKNVIKNPQLLVTDSKGLGYIGVLSLKSYSKGLLPDLNYLLSEDEYEKYVKERK